MSRLELIYRRPQSSLDTAVKLIAIASDYCLVGAESCAEVVVDECELLFEPGRSSLGLQVAQIVHKAKRIEVDLASGPIFYVEGFTGSSLIDKEREQLAGVVLDPRLEATAALAHQYYFDCPADC